ncbi:DeoR/GlpR family transcriptional regulator of sugar metabolism [Rhizobium halophytocola]|uniref:DeoR/GlpR family transcriptional regulator of sugar metabolism n=2 Tax=Rhizobium halophytocola TaxID=735519 RepID=A0ABS4E0T0_9HYPH|nr:DeoR/GlpR family transcriptional regulator of sugar metabolism [Rhizobium halophytocola]
MTRKVDVKDMLSDEMPSDSRHARQLVRRQMIAETVISEGSIRIEDLTERFGISLMTAHRDVDDLVGRGIIRKTRGIVTAAPTSLIESSDAYRATRQASEKRSIAETAINFVEPGQAILLDDSTTVQQMTALLPAKVPLTAITNSVTLINELREIRDITLIGLGGQYVNWCNAFMGHITVSEIRRLRADTVFLSMSAIVDDIVFHQSPETVETKRAMFECAAKRILLCDHTKFERRALHRFADLDEFDVVIVDEDIPITHLTRMRSAGINVVVAGGKKAG